MADYIRIKKHLDNIEAVKNRIALVGVELEGGWTKLPEKVTLDSDGSVFDHGRLAPAGVQLAIGELPSRPMPPASLAPWMRKWHPTHVDHTCGLHLHMSFNDIRYYEALKIPEYTETLAHYLELWAKEQGLPKEHEIYQRLAGKNQYCIKEFWADEQIRTDRKSYNRDRPGHRYTAVNYCYGQHGTIEYRALPMFPDPEQSIRAVRHVLDITNATLLTLARKSDGKLAREKRKFAVEFEERGVKYTRKEIKYI